MSASLRTTLARALEKEADHMLEMSAGWPERPAAEPARAAVEECAAILHDCATEVLRPKQKTVA